MFYDKKIKYLDVYEKGEKLQNAGFVRLEAREDKVAVQIRVEKLRSTDTCMAQVMLSGSDREGVLGEIQLERGRGVLECRNLPVEDLAGEIAYNELEEIYLKLPGERILRCVIQEKARLEAAMIQEDGLIPEPVFENVHLFGSRANSEVMSGTEQIPESEAMPGTEQVSISGPMPGTEPMSIQESLSGTEPMPMFESVPRPEPMPIPEPVSEPESMPVQMYGDISEQNSMPVPESMSEPAPILRPIPTPPQHSQSANSRAATKWQQLSAIYPHIRPFGDARDYLQLRPEDFVILTKQYYPLVANSFLLHGFYNYGHLILSRETRREGEHFYIGVPGNFYEKEKQVAVLFGFESFEGKAEPAKNGDFGYYMISVEI